MLTTLDTQVKRHCTAHMSANKQLSSAKLNNIASVVVEKLIF